MSPDPRLRGVLTALITPLEDDGERVDLDALKTIIDHVLDAGGSGVVVLGGTGEYTALTQSERERAIATAVAHTAGRGPVIVGIVAPGIGDAKEAARVAEREGADFIMPVTPYYVNPTQDGMRGWYHSLVEATDLPIILYNIPSKTGVNITPETVLRLTEETGRIAGIKECTADLGQAGELIQQGRDKLAILAGEEYFALPEFLLGAQGAILASANVIPAHWVRLYNATQSGSFTDARDIYLEILPLLRAIFNETNPGPLKAAMRILGLPAGPISTPLVAPSEATLGRLRKALEGLRVRA